MIFQIHVQNLTIGPVVRKLPICLIKIDTGRQTDEQSDDRQIEMGDLFWYSWNGEKTWNWKVPWWTRLLYFLSLGSRSKDYCYSYLLIISRHFLRFYFLNILTSYAYAKEVYWFKQNKSTELADGFVFASIYSKNGIYIGACSRKRLWLGCILEMDRN